jgi:cell division protease FtsH
MSKNIDKSLELIEEKKHKLDYASDELKKHFIGMDDIIDRVISNISVWYMMPELITKPVVICLWGMTGVGKTDFVRRLVDLLDFKDRYEEIQLLNSGSSYCSAISDKLETSGIEIEKPGVLLLDEIQRFRSINKQGEDIHEYKFQDVWDILSDGYLYNQTDREYVLKLLYDTNSSISNKRKKEKSDDDEGEYGEGYLGDDYWNVKRFKEAMKLSDSIEDIAFWDREKRLKVIKDNFKNKSVYRHDDYTKLLIFISGNLDEAFTMAEGVDDINLDADIYHDYSKKISMIDIKDALKKRFKPEQIARFGNIHIIYPSLSKASYESIIDREIDKVRTRLVDEFNITVEVDQSVKDLIYSNGVFPVQGVRPVFSTISEVLESSIPVFSLKALVDKIDSFKISYSNEKISAKIGDNLEEVSYVGQIDLIKSKRRKNRDFITSLAVHEAGHALVYAVNFGTAPVQVAVDVASKREGTEGFVGSHDVGGSKKNLKKIISTCLAGLCAEKMVFGDSGRGYGVGNDMVRATIVAGEMVRNYGMGKCKTFITHADSPNGESADNDINPTNDEIKNIVKKMMKKTNNILDSNKSLFVDIVDRLIVKGQLMPKEFIDICSGYGLELEYKSNDEVIDLGYADMYQDFKNVRSD